MFLFHFVDFILLFFCCLSLVVPKEVVIMDSDSDEIVVIDSDSDTVSSKDVASVNSSRAGI